MRSDRRSRRAMIKSHVPVPAPIRPRRLQSHPLRFALGLDARPQFVELLTTSASVSGVRGLQPICRCIASLMPDLRPNQASRNCFQSASSARHRCVGVGSGQESSANSRGGLAQGWRSRRSPRAFGRIWVFGAVIAITQRVCWSQSERPPWSAAVTSARAGVFTRASKGPRPVMVEPVLYAFFLFRWRRRCGLRSGCQASKCGQRAFTAVQRGLCDPSRRPAAFNP